MVEVDNKSKKDEVGYEYQEEKVTPCEAGRPNVEEKYFSGHVCEEGKVKVDYLRKEKEKTDECVFPVKGLKDKGMEKVIK